MHKFFQYLLAVAIVAVAAIPASADDCRTEIEALYDGGFDPFQRPPHSTVTTVYGADGGEVRIYEAIWENPMRTVAGERGVPRFTLAIETELWNGPTIDGPWTKLGSEMPADRGDQMREVHAQEKRNLTETSCLGEEDGLLRYSFRTQTDPDASGKVTGGFSVVSVDPDTGLPKVWDKTDLVFPWVEGVSDERWVTVYDYDPSLKLEVPDE